MSAKSSSQTRSAPQVNYPSLAELGTGMARATAGALIFSLPMMMTMEMWWLGFYIDPLRLALLLALMLPLLVKLSRYGGIRQTRWLLDDIADAFVVIAIAFGVSLGVLWIFGIIAAGMPWEEILGKAALQTFPGAIGAMLARNQFGGKSAAEDSKQAGQSYWGELFLMGVGALFLSLNVSPTEEIVLIAYKMTLWQELALVGLSVAAMHAFVYSIDIRGSEPLHPGAMFWDIFARFTVTGYAIVLVVSLYVLWTFGRTDGLTGEEIASAAVVLSFPGAIGAAAARLIL